MTTEPVVICRSTILDCWKGAAELLVSNGDRAHLVVHAERPIDFDEEVLRIYDPRRFHHTIRQSARDVANTIFPRKGRFQAASLDEFFAHYKRVYEHGARRTPHAWGTYFGRLTCFGRGGENQLRRTIDALTNWKIRPRAAFVLHLSSPALDKPRPQGAPCWQYGQFVRSGNSTLSLTAVYRSHDYFAKALGNLAGLRRLLLFVCQRAELEVGTLTCVSTVASGGPHTDAMLEMISA